MPKRIEVLVGDARGVATLFAEAAPQTAQAIWDALPLEGILQHANFSGEEASFPVRALLWERENQIYEVVPGDLGYFVTGPAICLYYGSLHVISPGSVFGRVVENLPALQRTAKRTWKERGIRMALRRLEG